MNWSRFGIAIVTIAVALLSGCGLNPVKPAATHIRAEDVQADANIPPPVLAAPPLPRPRPTPRPETYSVVVSNVKAQELLFALARDARLNIDIHPDVTGVITLNAIDQTLPQILSRISRQIDMRYEMDGANLVVMRDSPYLRIYKIDYVNLTRDARSTSNLSTQVAAGGGGSGGGGGGSQNNSTSIINSQTVNKFWDTLVSNVKDLLQETDKILPAATAAPAAAQAPAAAVAAAAAAGQPPGAPPAQAAAPAQSGGASFREAASVIANSEAGVLSIRATSRQHEKVQEFLDQVLANAKRQVLIEATVAEVQLNSDYQRGIDWSRLRTAGGNGFQFQQSSAGTPAGVTTGAFVFSLANTGANFLAAIRLLESFGDVRVLSSPKLSVLNNQTAVLKVVDNIVYFSVQASTTSAANSPAVTTFNTTAQTVPVGLILTVVPQISDTDTISLNVRPSISRVLRFVPDPNPSLGAIQNLIPEIQTRELESVLRVQNAQIAVLGGLMEDRASNVEDGIPGVRNIPGIGQLLSQRRDQSTKTELVIFLRPTVIRDASIEGDFRSFSGLLPDADFFRRPNPSRFPEGGNVLENPAR
jgi:MSHA biogenesis protein MshL